MKGERGSIGPWSSYATKQKLGRVQDIVGVSLFAPKYMARALNEAKAVLLHAVTWQTD